MIKKQLSGSVENALNDQMSAETFLSQVFLAYASWADVNGYPGVAEFQFHQSNAQRNQMLVFLKYLNDRGGVAKIQSINAPRVTINSLQDCLKHSLQHLIDNTKAICRIINLTMEERDWATFGFCQELVQEQVKKETLFKQLLNKHSLSAESPRANSSSNYDLDKELAQVVCGQAKNTRTHTSALAESVGTKIHTQNESSKSPIH